MTSTLSNFVYNLAEEIHKIKCTSCNTCCLEYTNAKDDLVEHKRLCCNNNYPKTFHKNWKKRFANTYELLNHDINKFILLLKKGVYLYGYRDDWENLKTTLLPEIKISIAI